MFGLITAISMHENHVFKGRLGHFGFYEEIIQMSFVSYIKFGNVLTSLIQMADSFKFVLHDVKIDTRGC